MAEELRLECLECGKIFRSRAHLMKHERTPHPPSEILELLRSGNASKEKETNENASEPPTKRFKVAVIQPGSILQNGLQRPIESESSRLSIHSLNLDMSDEGHDSGNNLAAFSSVNSTQDEVLSNCRVNSVINETDSESRSAVRDYCARPDHLPELLRNKSKLLNSEDLNEGSVTRDVYDFYKAFGDRSEPMYSRLHSPPDSFNELPQNCKVLISFCLEQRMSQGQIEKQYELQVTLDEINRIDLGCSVRSSFSDAKSFVSRVVLERKLLVKGQGWRRLNMVNGLGLPQVGVFLPIMVVLSRIVAGAGGTENIQVFKKCFDDEGNRLYHSPMNADIVESECQYTALQSRNAKKVFFSIYCDETLLSKSGSQDTAIVRIRAENVTGSREWHEVGIPPKLCIGDETVSKARERSAKLELFHRFIFAILEDICHVNLSKCVDSCGFEPCLLGFVCDQPQERAFLCLKRGNSKQDCSFCCFRSAEARQKRNELRKASRHLPNRVRNPNEISSPLFVASRGVEVGIPSEILKSDDNHENDFQENQVSPIVDKSYVHESGESDLEQSEIDDGCGKIPVPKHVDRYVPRNAVETVRLQLRFAVLQRRRKRFSQSKPFDLQGANALPRGLKLSTIQNQLSNQGALGLPPAFSSLAGITTAPYRLYSLPTIDLLHCFDLGPSKQFCDQAYLVLQRMIYGQGESRKKLVHIANRRIADLSGDTECRGMKPFKTVEEDRQASYTGKERRLLCPILWYAVMGLSPQLCPDEDDLFKSALYLDFMQSELKGVNRGRSTISRSKDEISLLQRKCIEACEHFMNCFESNESTKIHRFMVHLEAHLRGFGNLRMSDTGPNETLHRGIKKSYHATNKRQYEIGPQLLQVHLAAEMSTSPENELVENRLLLTRDPLVKQTSRRLDVDRMHALYGAFESREDLEVAESAVSQELNAITNRSIENHKVSSEDMHEGHLKNSMRSIFSAKDGFGRRLYKRLKRVTISADFEWDEETIVRQTLYAKAKTSTKLERFDSVRFTYENEARFGKLEAIIERLPTRRNISLKGAKVAIIRLFEAIAAEEGNRTIVDDFGYTRLAYKEQDTDIELVCVPLNDVKRRIVVLRDMWDACTRFGSEVREMDIPDIAAERKAARFFLAKNVKFTSLGEST